MDDDGVPVEDLMKLKLIVVGNQGTGKTCILNRFVNETFEENYQATIGLDFQSKNITIHDQDVRLILYDTAGQEKFRSLIPMYIREAQIILLIYDISDRESFDSMPKWLTEVMDVKNSESVFALIGNKIDLENERKITKEQGEKFCKENNINEFMESSAKTGVNAQNIFIKAAQTLYEDYIKYQQKAEQSGGNVDNTNMNYGQVQDNRKKIDNKPKKKQGGCC